MPRPEFHELLVADVRKETDDATSVAFHVPDALAENYRFTQGQYLTLRTEVDGEDLRRPYSVCVSPDKGELRVCVKKIPLGRFSSFVNDNLKAGDRLSVLPPMGRFHAPIEAEGEKTYVLFAGGSGITPVISIIETVLAREPLAKVTLFYGNRATGDIIFRERLSDLKDAYLGRLRVFHVLSDEVPEVPLFGGMMTQNKVVDLVTSLTDPLNVDWFFICGPGPMMDGAKAALEELGVEPGRIKIESFGSRPVAANGKAPTSASQPEETDEAADVEVIYQGMRKKIRVPFKGVPILDKAHEAKIDVPYACKGGVCCTCKAKLVEGQVDMDIVYGLEPDEIEAGYILTCQSHPTTDKLVIDYDG
ncbi:MAG: 2Fe-2S iron-sulfur cluster-binding protein [Pseudomonadota bacterium]